MSSHHYNYILVPGRHHLLSNFQHDYLKNIETSGQALDVDNKPIQFSKQPAVIWAVTSANHSNTRRNPLPANRRESAIEGFSNDLEFESFTYLISNLGPTERFADFTIKEIEVESRGQHRLTPANTVVAVSTPAVIALYEKLGYRILPLELVGGRQGKFKYRRTWDLAMDIVKAGKHWRQDKNYQKLVHPASQHILEKYNLGDLIVELHKDPLTGDEGDITETRDYETYRKAFELGAKRKYDIFKDHIQPGRIVDIGCATGAMIGLMSQDTNLQESDLYGIEVARPLYDICQRRKADGDFANENVFFYQRNILRGKLFPDNSINTTTAAALTHEVESYIGRAALLHFIKQIYQQTALGGVFINLDVVGPHNKDELVYMELNTKDGENIDEPFAEFKTEKELKKYLEKLSSYSRFLRFAQDFRAAEKDGLKFEQPDPNKPQLVKLRMADATDYLAKKDYTDNWHSEMHERFCFWSFDDWKAALEKAGFKLHPDSCSYSNPWLIDNRFAPAAKFYKQTKTGLKQLDYPDTNVILIAQKLN